MPARSQAGRLVLPLFLPWLPTSLPRAGLLQHAQTLPHAAAPPSTTRWGGWLPSSRPAPALRAARALPPQRAQRNPQTLAFLGMLGLPYNLDYGGQAGVAAGGPAAAVGLAQGEGPALAGPALQPVQPSEQLRWRSAVVAAHLEPSAGLGWALAGGVGPAHWHATSLCPLPPASCLPRKQLGWDAQSPRPGLA